MTKDFRLGGFLPFRLNRLASEVSRRLSTIYAERYGLEIPDWRVLATLAGRGAATSQAIVDSTRTHKSTVSRAAARLAERGLIERESSAADGREVVLRLTRKGGALMCELVPLVVAEEEKLLAALAPRQRAELLKLLGTLEASLELYDEENAR